MTPKKRLGEFLIEKGFITEAQLHVALEEQKRTGELLGLILMRHKAVSEETIALCVLANQLEVDFVHLKELSPDPAALERLPVKFANHYKVFPLSYVDGVLTVAMSNPLDLGTVDGLSLVVRGRIRPVLANAQEILEAVRAHYGLGADTVDQLMSDREPESPEVAWQDIREDTSEASISQFLNQLIVQACAEQATDIHIEPFEDEVRVRYRIDGALYDAKAPENLRFFRDILISRIKIMANLNIAEKRLPQDGRFKVNIGGQTMDLRVSILPTAAGEGAVLRILNAVKLYSLKDLGFGEREQLWLRELLQRPYGIVFVTGPTGSGKTTTLYTCLSELNKENTKIITVEDPVEYRLKGVIQVQAHPAIGLTFATTLRSMLRHDPDVLMVGEVRDTETAEITVQSALTGHLVFSTLHTNDAASGVTRLLDMGIEPYLISSSVEAFIAQRLVRTLCPRCRVRAALTPDVAASFGVPGEASRTIVYEPGGCKECRMTGYRGRQVIVECLMMTDEVRALVTQRATAGEIRAHAVRLGMRTLLQHGWEKVREGIVAPGEVLQAVK